MQALSQLSYGPGVAENEIIARHAGQHKLFFTKISEGLEALPDLGESLLPGRSWLTGAAGGCLVTGGCRGSPGGLAKALICQIYFVIQNYRVTIYVLSTDETPMPRVTRIDRSDAFAAIDSIISRGEAPTHINVRAELGQRGSPPVISNFIGSWFACYGPSLLERAPTEGGQPAVSTPPTLGATSDGGTIAALTAAALMEIQRSAAAREEAHQRTIDAAKQELAQQQQALHEQIKAFELQQQGSKEHIERCYSDRNAALQERDRALADAANLRQALGESKAQLAMMQRQLEQLGDLAARISRLETKS